MGITGYYLAIQYIDLSKAAVLYWTNPMMTAVIAYFWLHEAVSCVDWIAIGCSFTGIIFIQNPLAMNFVEKIMSKEARVIETLGSLAALGGAVFISISMI